MTGVILIDRERRDKEIKGEKMGNLKEEVINFAKETGAELVGVMDLNGVDFPAGHSPKDYLPEASSAVSFALSLNKGNVLNLPDSRNGYMLEFNEVNRELNSINHQIGRFLEKKGFLSFGVPGTASKGDEERLAADISHKHMAVRAGIGEFGINNLIITEEHGPCIRFSTLVTTANIDPTGENLKGLCDKCERCVEICPVDALSNWEENYSPRNGWRIDKESCYHRIFVQLNGKRCGLCIKACPYSKK